METVKCNMVERECLLCFGTCFSHDRVIDESIQDLWDFS